MDNRRGGGRSVGSMANVEDVLEGVQLLVVRKPEQESGFEGCLSIRISLQFQEQLDERDVRGHIQTTVSEEERGMRSRTGSTRWSA